MDGQGMWKLGNGMAEMCKSEERYGQQGLAPSLNGG